MVHQVFDRRAVSRHQARAAATFDDFSFLAEEVGDRLTERLDDITRAFPLAVDLGSHGGLLAPRLRGRHGIETLISTDFAPAFARRCTGAALACDEEALPFAAGSLDLVVSSLALHWVNDLPGAFVQIRQALKPDGLFIGAMLGGETLKELRECLVDAEVETEGGLSPRTSPLTDVRDLGMLLQRAGFALPVVDTDRITVTYGSALKLMQDLRGMGESNAVLERRKSFSRRETLLRAAQLYHERHAGPDGRITATFQVLWMLGWAPAENQPQPKKPGSATHSLADALGAQICGIDGAGPLDGSGGNG